MAQNRDVFEVKLDDEFLMSSLFTIGEIALADIALAMLEDTEIDVVVGGLGLGYTANAVLENESVRTLIVIEALDAVIGWHQKGLVPLGRRLTSDPRCRMLQGDFFALAAPSADGFDPQEVARQFDAVLVDIDHSPSHILNERNRALYTVGGMCALARMLHPGGVFAMWSNDPPDVEFARILEKVFAASRTEIVGFPNLYSGGTSSCTIYVATTKNRAE